MYHMSKALVLALALGTGSVALAAGRNFQARLAGAGEVPPVAGATRGSAAFSFNRNFTRLAVSLQLRNGDAVREVHLHCAAAGSNGPIVMSFLGMVGPASVPLLDGIAGGFDKALKFSATLNESSIVDYASLSRTGCTSTLGHEITTFTQLAEAMDNGEIYVNAHSVAHPAGVARGQLRRGKASVAAAPPASPGTSSGY